MRWVAPQSQGRATRARLLSELGRQLLQAFVGAGLAQALGGLVLCARAFVLQVLEVGITEAKPVFAIIRMGLDGSFGEAEGLAILAPVEVDIDQASQGNWLVPVAGSVGTSCDR